MNNLEDIDISIRDKSENPIQLRTCGDGDFSCLLDMYEVFSPKPASQGLPPEDPETCECWAQNLLEIGMNLLVWREGKVIGHAAVVPDPGDKSGEFVIFVHQDFRNLGIGTKLTRVALEWARKRVYDSIWLTVANTNFIAIKLYKKIGFAFSEMDAVERTMVIML